jgi:hypothetical protein
VPAETRVVKIDNGEPLVRDQNVAGMHVGVNQAPRLWIAPKSLMSVPTTESGCGSL